MPDSKRKAMRVAMAAWEIGRVSSGLGVKIGGLGAVIEELPAELVKAAAAMDVPLEIEVLSPCFAHYDRSRMRKLPLRIPARLLGHEFEFEVYEHTFPDGQRAIYFWDEWQLHWTTATNVYPDDPQLGLRLYAALSQAIAGYVRQTGFDTIHLHDYHVGLVPFYLSDEELQSSPAHLTIHNATYQGVTPLIDGGYSSLDRIGLTGEGLFHRYFDFDNKLNLLKAAMLKVHEFGGRVTTVSGDLNGSWGYAAELRENYQALWARAYGQKGSPPGEVFLPNRGLDTLSRIPVAGITNGLADANRPENLRELRAAHLQREQERRDQRGQGPIFRHPEVQRLMLGEDHDFDLDQVARKAELKRLLHLETFQSEPAWDPILITVVGRLVEQKNLGLVADVVERTIAYDGGTKFIVLASAPDGDPVGKATEAAFAALGARHPNHFWFNPAFNAPLSRLILAGGDFTLIPSRFEPCGLVDYEASLLGTVVIGRATGGLVKVRHCAYLYEWLDQSDRGGEANAFWWQIRNAIDVYRWNRGHHDYLVRSAMEIDASWDRSARQYVEMYLYGQLAQNWRSARRRLIADFRDSLGADLPLFGRFFQPAVAPYGDPYDWQLRHALTEHDR